MDKKTWIEVGSPYLLMVIYKIDVRKALVDALKFWLPEGAAEYVADRVLEQTRLRFFGFHSIAHAKEDEETILQRFREWTEPGLCYWPPPAPWDDPEIGEVLAVKVLAHKIFPREG